jgi:hypothetical protein
VQCACSFREWTKLLHFSIASSDESQNGFWFGSPVGGLFSAILIYFGFESSMELLLESVLQVRVLEETQFTCLAGIPHNKVYNGFVICGKPKHAHVSDYEKLCFIEHGISVVVRMQLNCM